MRTAACLVALISFTMSALPALCQQAKEAPAPMELSHTVRPWEFLPVTGTRAALFGNETGKMEAWVYPLKLFREFHLNFRSEERRVGKECRSRSAPYH